ncbi:hypothetical protein GF389_02290 [Candidatus Dojkabacteria bacterium]|nr:hypothetical protein [Candidatus Dojkabacteria bacterium]
MTAEIKYRRCKNGQINTHIYYHCNRIRDYNCKEPYITEKALIKQLVAYLPKLKIDAKFLWKQFEDEIKRLEHLKGIMNKERIEEIQLTPHNTKRGKLILTEEQNQMLRDYLVHIMQFGTPEERLKILDGIKSKFELSNRKLILR